MSTVYYIIAVISMAGLLLSLYLTLAPTPTFCDFTSFISCDRVLSSPYASFLGVPTAFYGAIWFTVASSLSFYASENRKAALFLGIWAILGLAGVSLLIYVELFLINALCILCSIAHVFVGAVAILHFSAKRFSGPS